MAIDETKIGLVAARLMEKLTATYGEDADAQIDHVFLLVTVSHNGQDTIEFAPSDGVANYEGVGMLDVVKQHLLNA
jgi:hypothetical protein